MRIILSEVAIRRDSHTIIRLVNAHEIPILRAIHGDDDRFQVIKDEASSIELDTSPADEFERLRGIYTKRPEEAQCFYRCYRDQKELAVAMEACEATEKVVKEKVVKQAINGEGNTPKVAKPPVKKKPALKKLKLN